MPFTYFSFLSVLALSWQLTVMLMLVTTKLQAKNKGRCSNCHLPSQCFHVGHIWVKCDMHIWVPSWGVHRCHGCLTCVSPYMDKHRSG